MLLDTTSGPARRRGALMTALPAREIIPMVRPFDLNQHLEALQLLHDSQTGDGATVVIRESAATPPARFDASALDAPLGDHVPTPRHRPATGGVHQWLFQHPG